MPFDGEVIEGRYVPKELYVWEPPPKEKHFWHIEPGDSSARQVLKHAYTLIPTKDFWCRARFAEDAYGNGVKATDSRAVRMCFAGALYRAERDLRLPVGTAYEAYPRGLILINTFLGYGAARAYMARAIRRGS